MLHNLVIALLESQSHIRVISEQDSRIPGRNAMERLDLEILSKVVTTVQMSVIATL